MTPFRVAILPDFVEEGWPSMDLVAEMLLANLPPGTRGERLCPRFRRIFGRVPGSGGAGFNADRIVNRFLTYPRFARKQTADAFVVLDHSYAHLVHALPAERTAVYCHDLNAFRCLLEPAKEPRPRWFRALARRTLGGLQRAAHVVAISEATRAELGHFQLVDPAKVLVAPLGAAPEFVPLAPERRVPWLDAVRGHPWLLHVGSCVPRKRIDVLLDAVAAVRRRVPDVRFVKVGGPFTAGQDRQLDALGLRPILTHVSGVRRLELAEAYRRASAVLMPSDSEGFGLPVLEALACGAPVVASDLPVFREVGGAAISYAPVADVSAWTEAVVAALAGHAPSREVRLARAAEFSWARHAATVIGALRS